MEIPTAPVSIEEIANLKATSQTTISITEPPTTPPITISTQIESLRNQLSERASINFPEDSDFQSNTDRWSTHKAPQPAAVVNPMTEEDVAATVKWAVANNIIFAARSGAHGYTSTMSAISGPNSLIINMRGLNSVSVDLPNGTAILGGGVITAEVMAAAHAAKAHIMTGVCNTVGVVSAYLGGGIGNLISLYGMGVDNILSARVITATGEAITVSETENTDLWWGLRGAGHNFGIVTSLKVKAYEQINEGVHWAGTLAIPGSEENLETILKALDGLGFGDGKPIACTMIWGRLPPDFQPALLLNLWYGGSAEAAEKAFAPLLTLPLPIIMNTCAPTPYPEINAASDFACAKNGHKRPCYGISLRSLPIPTLVELFTSWVKFTEENMDAAGSVVLVECYDFKKAKELGGENGMNTAFAGREKSVQVMAACDYTDAGLDGKVLEFGNMFRDKLVVDEEDRSVYLNFATGDEKLESMYGGKERLDRLRGLKAKWDPKGVFNGYNPIK